MAEVAHKAVELACGKEFVSDRPLQLIAGEFCLSTGINHVLVGMRRVDYVKMFKEFFIDCDRFATKVAEE